MKLQRWNVGRGGLDTEDVFDDKGEWVLWADVLEWRDSIRAAVVVWMMAPRGEDSCEDPDCGCWDSYIDARKALDALLADGGETVHQCPPTHSGGIMPCCGRTPFEVTGDRIATDPKLVTCKGRTS